MSDYTMIQRINTNSIPPAVYDERRAEKNSCICIVERDGKYGMVAGDGLPFLPFAYDNISMVGFSLFLLVRNGKMGLLHVTRPLTQEEKPYEILNLIPCAYDFISFPQNGESFVCMRKNSERKTNTQIYFIKSREISQSYWNVAYTDRDYIVVTHKDCRTKSILSAEGKVLYTTSGKYGRQRFVTTYETNGGTVFLFQNRDNSFELVLLRKGAMIGGQRLAVTDVSYDLTGAVKIVHMDKLIRPILAGEHIKTFERDYALAFIAETDGCYQILDGKGELYSGDNYKKLTLHLELRGLTAKDMRTVLPLERRNIDKEPFEDL